MGGAIQDAALFAYGDHVALQQVFRPLTLLDKL
jgi:hypothetical protein